MRVLSLFLVLTALGPGLACAAPGPLLEMIAVEGGSFRMGSNSGDADEKPIHRVTVASFSISKTEVTQKLYVSIMKDNPSKYLGPTLPVETVSWLEAVAFCNALSKAQGLQPAYRIKGLNVSWDRQADGYRLPTEAEWEFAARGGLKSRSYRYPGGNSPETLGWYSMNAKGRTHPVAVTVPNELGLFDLAGNVWEWCWDWYGAYSDKPQVNPVGPPTGVYRAGKGGTWQMGDHALRTTNRVELGTPGYRNSVVGIRVVRNG